MTSQKNLFQRAIDALVEGRTRRAELYIAQYQRDRGPLENKVKGR